MYFSRPNFKNRKKITNYVHYMNYLNMFSIFKNQTDTYYLWKYCELITFIVR